MPACLVTIKKNVRKCNVRLTGISRHNIHASSSFISHILFESYIHPIIIMDAEEGKDLAFAPLEESHAFFTRIVGRRLRTYDRFASHTAKKLQGRQQLIIQSMRDDDDNDDTADAFNPWLKFMDCTYLRSRGPLRYM